MSRVLYVSTYQIYPAQTGGHIRSANIIKALASNGCEVRVFSLTGRRNDPEARTGQARDIAPGITEFVWPNRIAKRTQEVTNVLNLPGYWDVLFCKYFPYPKLLREWTQWCDSVIANSCFTYPVLQQQAHKKTILNSHNLEFERFNHRPTDKLLHNRLVKQIEINAARASKNIWCCAPDELAFFSEHATADCNVIEVPNAVFSDEFARDPKVRIQQRAQLGLRDDNTCIVFVGSRYGPNREAADWIRSYCKAHEQALQRAGIRFLVVGSVATAEEFSPSLTFTGFVDSVYPYLCAADYAINPVVSGSGTNIKVFEYLSARLPLISTTFGLRGMGLVPHQHYIELDTKNTPVNVLTQLPPPEHSAAMAERAFAATCDIVDMDRVVGRLLT